MELRTIFQLLHSHSPCKWWTELPGDDVAPAAPVIILLLVLSSLIPFSLVDVVFVDC